MKIYKIRFMKSWGRILNTIMWFTPKYKWYSDCMLDRYLKCYLMKNLMYHDTTNRWTVYIKADFPDNHLHKLNVLFQKLDKNKLNKNNFLC